MPGPWVCSHLEQRACVDSGTNQETSFRPPRHRGCSAEAFGLRLLQDRATFWCVWMVGIGDVSGQPSPAPSHPTLKEQITLTTMGLRRAMWKKADRQPETPAWETPSPLPPSPQNASKKHTILSDFQNLKAHLSQPLCDTDSYKTYFKHRFIIFLSHTCTCTANLLTRYLQRASYLEGDAGHQRESFVHSANICGVPPMGQSCPAGLFQVTETEREGWVLRRGERGSCWAMLPPPCLRCIFGILCQTYAHPWGVPSTGAERQVGLKVLRTEELLVWASHLRLKPGLLLLRASLSLFVKEGALPRRPLRDLGPGAVQQGPCSNLPATSSAVKWEGAESPPTCLDYFKAHT
ncbi:uncharacterized protein LOC116591646 [Mustela erminea]|uniref:uncharacterized protein LOC116591646 n=1 Tax=Mustela erminea TaxID=36723 RepID=UPI001386E617|nr:uncharacterized protein LOC116591646 [Mustela erminea]